MGCKKSYRLPHALKALHGPADGYAWPYDAVSYDIIRTAKIKAIKLLTGGDVHLVVPALREAGIEFFCARVMGTIHVGETKTGRQFVQENEHSIAALYQQGITYFEIHNEPNLYSGAMGSQEGFGVMWNNGYEYADWWLDALDYISPRFPNARWGFSAVSPGDPIPNLRYDPVLFLREAHRAISAADWQAVHVYWDNIHSTWNRALDEVRNFALSTDAEVMLTEFGNLADFVPKATKGHEYVSFYNEAKKRLPANVGPLFCWVMQSSSGFVSHTWRGSEIPQIVGAGT